MILRPLLSKLPPATRTRIRRAYYEGLLRAVPSSLYCRILTRTGCGYWPNLARPKTFNEHILHYNLTVRDVAMAFTADKYLLRDFVRSRLGPGYSAKVLRRWRDRRSATCEGLPDSYVVKASHGSGFNHVVHNGALSDERLRELLMSWGMLNFYWHRREWVYRYLKPNFYAEEYLGSESEFPHDYRAMVFNGRVEVMQIDMGKPVDHRRALLDRDWHPLPVEYKYPLPATYPERPAALGELIEIAETLGHGFRFVRVDMYVLAKRIVVGEMTFYPAAGRGPFASREQDLLMGQFWNRRTER